VTEIIPADPQAAAVAHEEHHKAAAALAMIEGFVIVTPTDIDAATPLLQHIKGNLNRVIDRKEEITKPLNAALKAVRDLFRPSENALKECERILKLKIATANNNIREANRIAQLATQAALQQGDVLAAAQHSGAIQSTEAPQGLQLRAVFRCRVVNPAMLPREFLMPDEAKIREHVARYGKQHPIPGVEVSEDTQVIARAT
jgi:hypothetical protein